MLLLLLLLLLLLQLSLVLITTVVAAPVFAVVLFVALERTSSTSSFMAVIFHGDHHEKVDLSRLVVSMGSTAIDLEAIAEEIIGERPVDCFFS